MRGEHKRGIRQFQQPVEDRFVLLARIAILEIRAACASDQQSVAGEHAIGHDKAVRVVGVSRSVDCIEREALDREFFSVGQPHRDNVCLGLFTHHRDAMRVVTQRPQSGDVVGMEMGVDGFHKFQVELSDELKVAVDPFQHRIDDECLAARTACEQVGIGTGNLIEKLTKDHSGPTAACRG